MVRIRI